MIVKLPYLPDFIAFWYDFWNNMSASSLRKILFYIPSFPLPCYCLEKKNEKLAFDILGEHYMKVSASSSNGKEPFNPSFC